MAVKATGASGSNLALAGCHDSTLAAVLASLGALERENAKWPPFTSSLAIELFRDEVDTPVSPQKQEEQGPSSPWLYKPSGPSDSDASADLPPSNPSNKIKPLESRTYHRLRPPALQRPPRVHSRLRPPRQPPPQRPYLLYFCKHTPPFSHITASGSDIACIALGGV